MVARVQRVGVWNFAAVIGAVVVTGCGGGNGGARGEPGVSPTPEIGQVSEALGTAPETGCTGVTYNGHDYWFCLPLRDWATARTKCESTGYNLVRIEDSAENEFVRARAGLGAWIGGNDATTEGTWVWTFGGSKFWTGTATGAPFGGLYSKWGLLQPDNFLNQDCGRIAVDGTWTDEACSNANPYVCESGADQCPADPQKVIPGVCGCGVADIDSDADGTLDCQDQCPNDATKIAPGDCGCSNAPKPAGTACSDGLCPANTACNGAGVCGNPAACTAPDTGCTFVAFQNHYYWICNHDRVFSDARQHCQAVGMDVTAIESSLEDNFLTSKAPLLDHVFVGGSDDVVEGTWVWKSTGQQFWSGGPTGGPTAGAYTNWEPGQPSDGLLGQDCMTKDPQVNGGPWEARSCTLAEGYACERFDLCPSNPLKFAPGQCGCAVADIDADGDGIADCVDACPVDLHKSQPGVCGCGHPDTDTDHDGILDCQDGCPNDATNAACTAKDDLPPERGIPTSPDATPTTATSIDPNNCISETAGLTPLPSGQTQPTHDDAQAMYDSVPNTGGACSRLFDPGVCPLDPNDTKDRTCTSSADCASLGPQYRCQYGTPTSCATQNTPECGTKTLRCGVPDATCTTDATACTDPQCQCAQYDVCPGPLSTGNSGPDDPNAYTPEVFQNAPDIAAKKQPEPVPVYTDPPEGPCARDPFGSGNCWCKLNMDDPPPVTEEQSKNGNHGAGSFLNVTFDPDVRFDVDLNPLPLGEATYSVDAGASFTATASVHFPPVQRSTHLIDIGAAVHADRCAFSTAGTRFKIFDVDFVDLFGNNPFDSSTEFDQPTKDCNKAASDYQQAGDRAKKALRDAQVLIEAYRALPAGVTFDKTTFCDPRNAGTLADPEFSLGDCSTEKAEETINRYIAYYGSRVQKLRDAMVTFALRSADISSDLQSSHPGDVTFLHISRDESFNIAEIPFFIGPIPAVITMDVTLDYGVDGNLEYRYSPSSGLAVTPGSDAELIAVSGKIVPSAGAGFNVFAGVGGGVPGFDIEAGIEGQLSLAAISANIEAGAGLSLGALTDGRAVPADLAAIGTGDLLFPPRQYEFFLNWFYGADLQLAHVLDGNLNAMIRLELLFFNKTFRKTFLHFDSPFNLPRTTLLKGGSRLPGMVLPVPGLSNNSLGKFEMQLPFVDVRPLQVPAAAPPTLVPYVPDPNKPLHFDTICNVAPPA